MFLYLYVLWHVFAYRPYPSRDADVPEPSRDPGSGTLPRGFRRERDTRVDLDGPCHLGPG